MPRLLSLDMDLRTSRRLALSLAAALASLVICACGSAPAKAPGTASVVSAPVRVAHTSLGSVGYRVVGSGPPLVLIMGYGWNMEGWDPRLVHVLALHNRVVMLDNSGVGHTEELPQPFSIDAMADQTSALITALGLGRPDVLGWSMGGMIAQALAVLHPAQVRRLVLAATYPGTGHGYAAGHGTGSQRLSCQPGQRPQRVQGGGLGIPVRRRGAARPGRHSGPRHG